MTHSRPLVKGVSLIIHDSGSIQGKKVEVFLDNKYQFKFFTKRTEHNQIMEEAQNQIRIERQLRGGT